MSDDALKLIVKISEGSVRDALSLLDRGLLSVGTNQELNLDKAQEIYGYFDKSKLIELFDLVLQGDENKVINIYRKFYDQGVEPKVFLNDFLELIYYFKNINTITLESVNFSLNDQEFRKIKEISSNVNSKTLILFWQFTIKTLDELDIVSNQNLSIEMFLIRLMHLESFKDKENQTSDTNISKTIKNDLISDLKNETISQIKNITQEKKNKPVAQTKMPDDKSISIKSFDQLLNTCIEKKEIKLKYELENNVNLVSFIQNRIEISFNENLDKNFVKDLSFKLFEWTGQRWIIMFSKNKGEQSINEKKQNKKKELFEEAKKTNLYKSVIDIFPDAIITDISDKEKK